MPSPAIAGPLKRTSGAGVGSGEAKVLVWPPGFEGATVVGVVVLGGLTVVRGGFAETVTGVGTRAPG